MSRRASGDCVVEELEEPEARAEVELTSMAAEGGEEGEEKGLTNSSDSPSDTMKEIGVSTTIVLISS